jgi:nitrogenase molybdenum-iron protein alpha chain
MLAHVVKTYGDIPHYTVSNDQNFQEYASLHRSKPDFVIARHGGGVSSLAARLGIPVLQVFYSNDGFGYQGLLTIGSGIVRILPMKRFCKSIAAHTTFPYKQWWLDQEEPFAMSSKEKSSEQQSHTNPVCM